MRRPRLPRDVSALLLPVLLCGSLALHTVQARKVSRLTDTLEQAANMKPFEPGDVVHGVVAGSGADGRAGRPRVIYWTSARCKWSNMNETGFRALYEARRDRYDFVVLSSDREQVEALMARKPPYPAVSLAPDAMEARFRAQGTPLTLVVSPTGEVVKGWSGAYIGAAKDDVERFFHMELPDPPRTR